MSAQAQPVIESLNEWIPIVDYAVRNGVSTSTLRRYIKAKKISYRIENGRYLLPANETIKNAGRWDEAAVGTHDELSTAHRIEELEMQLLRAQEQINELKMLVAIYEEKLGPTDH